MKEKIRVILRYYIMLKYDVVIINSKFVSFWKWI